jgi:hypothetical protein
MKRRPSDTNTAESTNLNAAAENHADTLEEQTADRQRETRTESGSGPSFTGIWPCIGSEMADITCLESTMTESKRLRQSEMCALVVKGFAKGRRSYCGTVCSFIGR